MTERLTERYAGKIRGVLSCFDRVVITGTIPQIAYAGAMNAELWRRKIRVFDFPSLPSRCATRSGPMLSAWRRLTAWRSSSSASATSVKSNGSRRSSVSGEIIQDWSTSSRPWSRVRRSGRGTTRRRYLKPRDAKCLHYYFYFVDEQLGLC